MIQVIKCEMTRINKRSHCIFENATTLSLLVLKADLKYMSVKKFTCLILKSEYFHTICNNKVLDFSWEAMFLEMTIRMFNTAVSN